MTMKVLPKLYEPKTLALRALQALGGSRISKQMENQGAQNALGKSGDRSLYRADWNVPAAGEPDAETAL